MSCTLNVRAPGRGNVFTQIRVCRNRRYGLCKLRVEIHIAVTGSVLVPYYYITRRTFFSYDKVYHMVQSVRRQFSISIVYDL